MMSNKDVCKVYHPVEIPLPCNTVLCEFKHHCFPGLNLLSKNRFTVNSVNDPLTLYSKPLINVKKPLPCLLPEGAINVDKEDPVLKLVREKYFWKRRKKQIIQLIHKNYKGKFNLKIEQLKDTKKPQMLPYGITRLADHLAKNPDKNFKGLYNWYFNNSLIVIESCGEPYLLHAGGDNLNTLYISSIEQSTDSRSILTASSKISIPLEENGPIFDVISSQQGDRIGIRQRDSCKFFFLEENHDFKSLANNCFSICKGTYPIISAAVEKEEICYVDANRRMKLWNASHRKCINNTSLPESSLYLTDKFIRVEFGTGNSESIVVADRKNIYFFDKRRNLATPSAHWSCDSYVEMCEYISLMIPSVKENSFYIGTNHSCLSLDIRSGFTEKWTHMLPQTPSVGHALRLDTESECSKEMLVMCSQSSDSMVAICNNWSSEPIVTCLPISLPNRLDTLHDARSNGILYHPTLQNKFDFSIIGLTSYKVTRNPSLFSLVSTGDIFHHKLESKEYHSARERLNRLRNKHLTYLEKWENNFINWFSSRGKARQVITHAVVMKDLFTKLQETELPEPKSARKNVKRIENFSKKELESYVDLLAPHLLNDYGVWMDSDWEDEENESNPQILSKSVTKVKHWMTTGEEDTSEIRVPEEDLSENEKNSMSDDTSEDSVLNIELSGDDL